MFVHVFAVNVQSTQVEGLETHTAIGPCLPVFCPSQGLHRIQVGGLPFEHSPSELVGLSSFTLAGG